MKNCSTATAALLANPPVGLQSADLFTFTLADGVTIYRWTSYDTDLLVNGNVYSSKAPWLERSRWGLTNTMTVPTLEVSLKALNNAFSGGADIKAQLTNGLFDGATATLDRVFFAAGTTVINDLVLIVTEQVVIATTGAGSINFATDARFTTPGHVFDPVNNTIEMVAGAGAGAAMTGNGNGVKGGGGGQYGVVSGFNPAGGTINFSIGVGGGVVGTSGSPGTADSWFNSASATLYAQGGTSATNGVAGGGNNGGQAAAVGTSAVANGGNSGGSGLVSQGNSGGGGAGGPNGAGSNGQTTPGTSSGGFGGNGDGNNVAGGLGVTSASAANPGYTESLWWGTGLVGPGSGGGGSGTASGAPGGAGGLYGGGGGGGQTGNSAGGQGVLVISWGYNHAGIRLFGGNVANIDITGNVATINIKGKNNNLDQYAPRNLYQLGCEHAFCDTGCTLARASFTTSYTVGSGSGGPTRTFVPWSGAAPGNASNYRYGTVKFTSGVCSGQSRTVRLGDSTGLTLINPLHGTPTAGDGFTAFEGCDKQLNSASGQDCTARSNTQNWRAFPYVPPADFAA